MIRFKGRMIETLTERELTTAQRNLLCRMKDGAKIYDGYTKPGLWITTDATNGINRLTLNSLVAKKLVKKKAGGVYEITMKGREWANTSWNPGRLRNVG